MEGQAGSLSLLTRTGRVRGLWGLRGHWSQERPCPEHPRKSPDTSVPAAGSPVKAKQYLPQEPGDE